jgi:rubrerythrin
MWPYRPVSGWAPQEEEGEGEERQRHWVPKREPRFPIPTGDQAVPWYDPKWDPENDKDEWSHNHFIHCILKGLRRAKIKPLNYSQVTAVQQGLLETPVAFLQRLKDALQKHTNIVPESQEEEIILKDKFLTQSVPDSHKKLQKLVAEESRDLDQLVHVAMSVYYNRDLEKEKKDLEKEKRKDKWQEALIAAPREASPGQSPNPRTCFQCGQTGHCRRECPRRKLPPGPCPICQGKHWKAHCPQFPGETRSEPPTQLRVLRPPIQAPVTTLKAEEPRVILTIEKHKVSLLINTGASISAIPFSPGPRSSKKITV